MARAAVFWVFVVLWTALLGLVTLAGTVLTLGLLRHEALRLIGPLWGYPVLWVAGTRLEVHGGEHLKERRAQVLVLNHASTLDAFVVAALAPPGAAVVGKIELWRTPGVGLVFAAVGVVFIDRGAREEALATLSRVAARVRDKRLTAIVAPEGTRSKTGRLQPFKMGGFVMAQQAGVAVVPMVIHHAPDLLPLRGWPLRPGVLRVQIEPPRAVPGEGDLRPFAEALHRDYQRWLGELSEGDAAGP